MILVVGEALVDLVIDLDGTVTATLGGGPFNTARACGRLGADVAFLGAVSVDRFGGMLARRLADDRVSLEHLVRTERPTTLAAAELDEGGAAIYRFYFEGTSAPALTGPSGADCDVLFTGGLGLILQPMADTAEALVAEHAESALVMVDINCRPLVVPDRDSYVARMSRVLAHADIVKASDEDLAYLVPGADPIDAARAMVERGPSAVLVTAGGSATTVVTAAGEAAVPVAPVDVVDTIGAGDSFGAGVVSWWAAAGLDAEQAGDVAVLRRAVAAANAVAAVVVGRRGADPPWRHELPDDWSP